MKSKKKMLLALGAMSIAAIGAGSVSTFAWYTATNSAKASTAINAQDLATVEPATITEDIDVEVVIDRVDSGDLHLATIVTNNNGTAEDDTDDYDEFISKYELNGNYYPYSPTAGTQFNIYSVAVKQTNQQKADKLDGSTVSVTLAFNKVIDTEDESPTKGELIAAPNSRAKGYLTATATEASTAYDFTKTGTYTIATSAELDAGDGSTANKLTHTNGQVVGYVFVYIEGANGAAGADSKDAHGSNITGYFGVTVTGNSRS